MSDKTADELAYELAGRFSEEMTEYHGYDPQRKAADELLAMVRAVVREELDKMQQRAEAAQKAATQERWDSPEFKAQVDALREGRPVIDNHRCDECNRIERFGHWHSCSRNNMPVKSDFGGLGPCPCGDVNCQD